MHNFPDFIPKSRWPPNSPGSLFLRLQFIDWSQIATKAALIDEIKRSVKRVEKEKILNPISDFAVRLRMLKNNSGGEYIR